MKIEKRSVEPTKTYRSTHHRLDSRKNTLLELKGLQDRLNERIEELSVFLRKERKEQQEPYIDQMNRLKLNRTQVQYLKERLSDTDADDEVWRNLLPDIKRTFNSAEKLLVTPPQ